jgi:hypothetical protein
MGILATEKKKAAEEATPKRKSGILDLSVLKPLNVETGTKNFAGYRESTQKDVKGKRSESAMDSDGEDDDDDVKIKVEDEDDKDPSGLGLLSPEDARREGELEEGVRKIKVSQSN